MATEIIVSRKEYLQQDVKTAPLAVFRILFGLIMVVSIIRFWAKGWIEELYLQPDFHFHYTGFEFVSVPGNFTYVLFVICGLAALMVAIGFKYRLAIVLFFLSFSYIELLDKTTYLNHYYFISLMSFMMIWLPAQVAYSVDAYCDKSLRSEYVPRWTVDAIKLILGIVYFYAGLAKLSSDWLLQAMPLAIWLPSKAQLPFIGSLMSEQWMAYLFSWGGVFYDLTIVFFLLWKRTRLWAFGAVIVFHVLTRILFPIGMFPYIMICSTLIFFSEEHHDSFLKWVMTLVGLEAGLYDNRRAYRNSFLHKVALPILLVFLVFQLLFPLRSLLRSENIFWTERGYRYSWRVMLMEKTGYANFRIEDTKSGNRFYVQNDDFLTALQRKEMSTQPDFILEYGRYLGEHFIRDGHQNVAVYVDSYAALNGRRSQVFIDPEVNLMDISYTELCNAHITPLIE